VESSPRGDPGASSCEGDGSQALRLDGVQIFLTPALPLVIVNREIAAVGFLAGYEPSQ
jgi:hypothetical protein